MPKTKLKRAVARAVTLMKVRKVSDDKVNEKVECNEMVKQK